MENYQKTSNKEAKEQENKELSIESNLHTNTLKNCREKTPMCLVNDLARYNKVS